MKLKLKQLYLIIAVTLLSGCSSYSEADYGKADDLNAKSKCVNMEPAQEMVCKEREKKLIIGLGADKNCNHPYEYERNRCINEQVKQKKLLNESIEKHKK